MARPSQRLAQAPLRAGVQSSAALGRSTRGPSSGYSTTRLVLYIDGVRHVQSYDDSGRESLTLTPREDI